MSDEDRNFEAYLDWDAVTQEMADDLHEAVLHYKAAQETFTDTNTAENAADLLRAQHNISNIAQAVHRTIYTQPVMVHVAGPKKTETDEDGDEVVMQRCKRCGSMLQMWHEGIAVLAPGGPHLITEDEVPWWDEDKIIAKANTDSGIGMYAIDPQDRELDKHERMCPSLNTMLG